MTPPLGWLRYVAVGLMTGLSTEAAVQFSFTYNDVVNGTGAGFDDPVLGATRRAALTDAAGRLAGYFSAYTATIELTVSSESVNSGNLASAGSPIWAVEGFQRTFVQEEILGGGDQNGATADGGLNYNFHHNWSYTDTVVGGSQYDFKAVTMHELMHTLGFFSYIDSEGRGALDRLSGQQDVWSSFDQFVTDSVGNNLVTGDFRYDTGVGTAPLTGNPGVYFDGPNAVAAYGGRVPLYSPTTFLAGSSVSHTDDTTFTGVNRQMMNATVATGLAPRTLSAVELGILQDLGYASVPEPVTVAWWVGVGALGWGVGRRAWVVRAR